MMKKWISGLLLIALLCGICPLSSADQLEDSLNQAVPFGVVHAEKASALAVYKSPGARNSTGQLQDYQLCAIMSSKTSGGALWYEIRYISSNAVKEGYIRGDVFFPLTLAGLITVTADAAAGEALRTLIGASKTNVFIAPSAAPSDPPSSGRKRYVLNTKTMKFHLPGCTEVTRITEENRKNTTTTRESLIDQGYAPCQKCNP